MQCLRLKSALRLSTFVCPLTKHHPQHVPVLSVVLLAVLSVMLFPVPLERVVLTIHVTTDGDVRKDCCLIIMFCTSLCRFQAVRPYDGRCAYQSSTPVVPSRSIDFVLLLISTAAARRSLSVSPGSTTATYGNEQSVPHALYVPAET